MTRLLARQNVGQMLNTQALQPDNRTIDEKANQDALMAVRGQINDVLSVEDSHQFIDEMDSATNKWDVINKWQPYASLVTAIGKARTHSGISIHKLNLALDAAREAGWIVEREGWLEYQVEWGGQ